MSKTVVMGGSFNPPTLAHFRLMQTAMQQLSASKGIFVPVSHAYLKRKMHKASAPVCLSEETRLSLLGQMCENGMTVSRVEMQNPKLYTEQTMALLQQEFPHEQLYFLAGSDKLALLRNWAVKTDFFAHFHVAIVCRDGIDPMALIDADAVLKAHRDAFCPILPPENVEHISSTAIREAFISGNTALLKANLHPGVYSLFSSLDPHDYPPEIERFTDEYAFLSNGYLADITYQGLCYRCAEAAFRAAGCEKEADKKRFLLCDAPKAKMLSSKILKKEDWEECKLSVMEDVLKVKFSDPILADKLLQTSGFALINGTGGKDTYWGVDRYTDKGENMLGKLLMQLRDHLQAERS